MLEIHISGCDFFDESKQEFVTVRDTNLKLEHSLLSVSRWESKWHKPFLGIEQKTEKEILDYIRCMTITQNVDPNVYLALSTENVLAIKSYMNDPMTATWFNERNNPKSKQKIVTSELIYYWMFSLMIPMECEKWHLNRLLTLIRVCNTENAPKKKMRKKDIYKQNAELNAKRQASMRKSSEATNAT